jgi:hypothetical protein
LLRVEAFVPARAERARAERTILHAATAAARGAAQVATSPTGPGDAPRTHHSSP